MAFMNIKMWAYLLCEDFHAHSQKGSKGLRNKNVEIPLPAK